MISLLALSFACLPCLAQIESDAKPASEFLVILKESTGVARPSGPVRGGIPFSAGELSDSGKIVYGESAGDSWVMSRWPDGSVRWLGVELNAPPIPANSTQSLQVKLTPGSATPLQSNLNYAGLSGSQLFALKAPELNAAITYSFDCATAFGPAPAILQSGQFEVELATTESCTIKRVDQFQAGDGREVIRFTTRATNFRDSKMLHISHTMEVVRGTHHQAQWAMHLPVTKPGKTFEHRQLDEKFALIDGKSRAQKISGVYQQEGLSVAITDFWKLFPSGFRRDQKQLDLLLACPTEQQHLVLEPGMGRTHHIWIWTGDQQPRADQAIAQADTPIVPSTSPQRATASLAAGPLKKPNSDSRLDDIIKTSVERVFKFSEGQTHHYGFFDWGDFFVHDGTLSYTGCINQEYDPAIVMHLAYLRTGDPAMLYRALPMARHYSDVDIAVDGGVFQHRATRHHADAWIAKVMANGFYKSVKKSPVFDGSPESLLKVVKKKNKGMARELEPLIKPLLDSGEPSEVIVQTALEIMGQNILNNIVNKLGKGDDEMTMQRYCEGIATSEMARDYGFKNATAAFKPFFELYGGSWDNFPTFHIDNSPDQSRRHTGGHSLVESVIFAWWETGDPRFLEVALRVGRHHTNTLVPQEINKLGAGLGRSGNPMTRTVAWPLINMCRLYEMTEGMEGEEELHQDLYASAKQCAAALIEVPFKRIEGSIHAGVTMEALTNWHQLSGDDEVANYLVGLARYWAANVYDKRSKSFRYKAHKSGTGARGFSGLVSYGLSYAQQLKPHTATWNVFRQAWGEMMKPQKKVKPMTMTLRSAARTINSN